MALALLLLASPWAVASTALPVPADAPALPLAPAPPAPVAGSAVHFEPNRGHVHPDVAFTARAGRHHVFLTPTEAVFVVPAPGEEAPASVVRLQLVDANPAPRIEGRDAREGVSHYFLGDDPAKWATDVPRYGRVVLESAWPGVDVVYYGTADGDVEHDFVVAPGVDASSIRFRLVGGEVALAPDGSLRVGDGFRLTAPVAWQDADGARVGVASRFVPAPGGVLGFAVGPYDRSRPLVIDPIALDASTYLGGAGTDDAVAVAVDANGSAHVLLQTTSVDYPVVAPYQTLHGGGTYDNAVTKLTPSGTGVLWATYIGGWDPEEPVDIEVDAGGSVFFTGKTRSANYPTVTPYEACSTSLKIFVTKLDSTGSSLAYSTCFATLSTNDQVMDMALATDGSVFLTGYMGEGGSGGLPLANPYQSVKGTGWDVFVAKLAPSGSAVLYSTWLGGAGNDHGTAIAVASDGTFYVAGYTPGTGTTFPMVNAFQSAPRGGGTDAFVSKFSADGSALVYSTRLGGDSNDEANAVAVDGSGVAHVVGTTASVNFPTLNPFQRFAAGADDAFYVRLAPTGNTIAYGTFLGGSSTESVQAAVLAADGSMTIGGYTSSSTSTFPATNAYQTTYAGNADAFVARLTPSGGSLVFATYLGGTLTDRGQGLAVGADGRTYLVGYTDSTNFPQRNEAYGNAAGRDGFLSVLLAPPPRAPLTAQATPGPARGEIQLAWSPPEEHAYYGLASYQIWSGTSASTLSLHATVPATSTSYVDTGHADGTTAFYAVHAVDSAGRVSDASSTVSGTTFTLPGTPGGFAATSGPGAGQITLSWTAASNGGTPVTNHRVYRGDTLGSIAFLAEIGPQLTFTDGGHFNGVTKFYRVSAVNALGEGPLANAQSASTFNVPNAPSLNTISRGPGGGSLSLSWTTPSNGGAAITGYKLYRGPSDAQLSLHASLGVANSYVDSGLGNGETWFYRVSAVNVAGDSLLSNSRSQSTYNVASEPRSLAVSSGPGGGTLTLSWLAPTSNGNSAVSGYRVYRGADAGSETFLTQIGNTLGYVDSGLGNGVTWSYRVTALNEAGESSASSSASGTTFALPTAPQEVVASTGPDAGQVSLSWKPPASNGGLTVTGYRIHRGPTPGSETFLAQVGGVLAFVDGGLATGETASYRVSALTAAGEGALSDSAVGTAPSAPGAPTGLVVSAGPGPGELTLAWEVPVTDGGLPVTGYVVRGGASPGDTKVLATPNDLGWMETQLPAGVARYYRVAAVNAAGEGAATAEASAVTFTPPGAPLAATSWSGPGPAEVTVEWQPPEQDGGTVVTGYRLYAGATPETATWWQDVDAGTFTVADASLESGTRRFYLVSAQNAVGEGPASAPTATTAPLVGPPPPLPSGRGGTSAAFGGHHAFVFGGSGASGELASIVRFDPFENTVEPAGTVLPSPRAATSAVWVPQAGSQACHPTCVAGAFYVFGGRAPPSPAPLACHPTCSAAQQIVKYDPVADVAEILEAHWDDGRSGTSAVWNGTVAFVFGGSDEGAGSFSCHPTCGVGREIWKFDPATGALTRVAASLPVALSGTSAVWDPVRGVAYVFGGRHDDAGSQACHPTCERGIVVYDPRTDTTSVAEPQLPSARWNTSASWDPIAGVAYVFGGEDASGPIDEIVRFDPVTGTVAVVGSLPSDRSATSAVFAGTSAYVFGGATGAGASDEIVRFTPGAPRAPSAGAGPDARNVVVAWDEPADGPADAYRVYRGFAGGPLVPVALVPGTSTSYLDRDLADDTAYEYRVTALLGAVEGPASPEVAARTFALASAPRDLQASAGVGTVALTWTAPEDDGRTPVVAYRIYRAGLLGGEVLVAEVTGTSYVDTACRLATVCRYTVAAVNAVGASDRSNEATALGTGLLG